MELFPDTLLNNGTYKVIKLLGKGAMGTVYLVKTDYIPQKVLVVKELNFSLPGVNEAERAGELFRKEAEFMAKFNHPGLPKTFGIFSQDGKEYLSMEYIEGLTLEEVIQSSCSPISAKQAILWIIELTSIMDYLHNSFQSPIVYRDLKPSNIMITVENKVKLIDFGIARYYNPDKESDTMRLGSPGYAAPEQYREKAQSSPLSDIYGLGVILFQMLTKYDPTVTPFEFPSMKSLNPSIPCELEKIVLRAIEVDPLKRYISMQEFREVLMKHIEFGRKPAEAGQTNLTYYQREPDETTPSYQERSPISLGEDWSDWCHGYTLLGLLSLLFACLGRVGMSVGVFLSISLLVLSLIAAVTGVIKGRPKSISRAINDFLLSGIHLLFICLVVGSFH